MNTQGKIIARIRMVHFENNTYDFENVGALEDFEGGVLVPNEEKVPPGMIAGLDLIRYETGVVVATRFGDIETMVARVNAFTFNQHQAAAQPA